MDKTTFKVIIKIKPSEKFLVVVGPPIHKRVNKGGGLNCIPLIPLGGCLYQILVSY